MAEEGIPFSATPTLNNEDNNTATRETKKMDTEAASIDTTASTDNHAVEKETRISNEKQIPASKDEEEEENFEKVHDATAGPADLTRTTSTIQYIEGFKLYILMASMTLIFFLVMIDITIVSTVGRISVPLTKSID